MLGRYQRGNFQSLLFEEAQGQLKELLFEFGPPSRSINVLDPFWRLQNDGIWKVEDESGTRVAETVEPPTVTTLVDRTARGNFVPRDRGDTSEATCLYRTPRTRTIISTFPCNFQHPHLRCCRS